MVVTPPAAPVPDGRPVTPAAALPVAPPGETVWNAPPDCWPKEPEPPDGWLPDPKEPEPPDGWLPDPKEPEPPDGELPVPKEPEPEFPPEEGCAPWYAGTEYEEPEDSEPEESEPLP